MVEKNVFEKLSEERRLYDYIIRDILDSNIKGITIANTPEEAKENVKRAYISAGLHEDYLTGYRLEVQEHNFDGWLLEVPEVLEL